MNLNSESISLLEKVEMGSFIFIFPLNLPVMRLEETALAVDIDASSSFIFSFQQFQSKPNSQKARTGIAKYPVV